MRNTELELVKEEFRQEPNVRNNRLDDSLFSKDLAPHYMKLAGQLASSDLVPKCFRGKPQDLFLCWSMGYQVGLTPEQSMQCIAVINGKPAMWGDDMLALCMSHKDFEDIIETPIIKNEAVIGYTCIVKRKGKADKESVFTLEMAKKAGLLAKGGVWNQYPERMLKLRARGFGLRDAFPDALKGIKPREEVEDYIDGELATKENKASRTELLKKDILIKQGVNIENLDTVYGSSLPMEDKISDEESTEVKCDLSENKIEEETSELHSKIKKLIIETLFTEDRVKKALDYYEVDCIEELSREASTNFIEKLLHYKGTL
jgi:hypothetical protein